MPNDSLNSICSKLIGSKFSGSNHSISGFSVDSRSINPNEIFFALNGCKQDGHTFLQEVAHKGAAAAVVSEAYQGPNYNLPLIRVRDPLHSLQLLAKDRLQGFSGKVVAVTGSLGKTTTKEFIAALLKTKYKVMATPGNSNSQIGLPLAILNHTSGQEDILVLEMGITHKGQLSKLLEIAPPDIAVLTLVSHVHIANYNSIEDLVRAKAEILQHPKTKLGVVWHDLPLIDEVYKMGNCRKISFSLENKKAQYYWCEEHGHPRIHYSEGVVTVPFPELPGKHNRHNLLAAIVVAKELGVTWRQIQRTIPKLILPDLRLQHILKRDALFVNDSYNASELSVKAALNCLPAPEPGKKRIAVLGDIVDLGAYADQIYTSIGETALATLDHLICLGKDCQTIVEMWKKAKRPVTWCQNHDEIIEELKKILEKGDVVLLKGSNKHKLWEILNLIEPQGKR